MIIYIYILVVSIMIWLAQPSCRGQRLGCPWGVRCIWEQWTFTTTSGQPFTRNICQQSTHESFRSRGLWNCFFPGFLTWNEFNKIKPQHEQKDIHIYIPGTSNRTQIFVFSGISVLGTEILKGDGNSRRGQKFVLWCFWDLNSHLNFNEPFLGSHYEKLVPWMAQRCAPHQFFPWNLAAHLIFASALSASFQLAALKGRNLWLNLWVRNH